MAIGSFTHPWSLNILRFLFQNVPLVANPPWVGIGKANGSKNSFVEFSGAGYSRVQLDSSYFPASTAAEITLGEEIIFPVSTGFTGETYAIGFFTSNTAPMPFAWGDCNEREVIKNYDSLRILPGAYTHYFSPGSTWSMWLKNAVLNHFYRGEAIPLTGTDIEFGYVTTPPNDADFGTEPGAGGYARVLVGRNSTNFKDSNLNGQELNNIVEFPWATASQGTATHSIYFLNGQYLMWNILPTVAPINTNQRLALKAGQLFQLDP